MLPAERQRRILAMLAEHGSVRTVEVAEALDVTNETVRKDFETLEDQGVLTRVHGGATRQRHARKELAWSERQSIQRKEKRAIAKLAAALIRPDETIFLDASSTVLTLCEFLPEVPLTILTNAHNVFTALESQPAFDLICTGGRYDAKSRSYIGLMAEDSLRRYHIDRMFCSGSGIDLERGVSESNSRQAHFKERVIPCAEEIILLADHTKLGVKSSFFFAGTNDISLLVTDSAADPAFLEELGAKGMKIETARRNH
jgi:DeoR/GlpR family transcriptional regulator of sugar metabolism